MKTTPKDTVIRCGNHWLLTDDIQTKIEWISDRAEASRHTRKWAERFAKKSAAQVQLFTVAEAQALADRVRQERLRSAYFYAMDAEVRRLRPDTDYYIPGVGCSAVCFAVDPAFAAGVPHKKAAADFIRTRKGRPLKKGGTA